MSFKDKFDEYKERKEAQNYFRNNNDQFLNTNQWIKVIALGILGAIAVGVVLGMIINLIHIRSMLFYLIAAYLISSLVTNVSGIHSKQMGILAACLALFCFVVVNLTLLYYPLMNIGFSAYFGPVDLLVASVKMFVTGDIFTTILALVGVFIAYQQAQ